MEESCPISVKDDLIVLKLQLPNWRQKLPLFWLICGQELSKMPNLVTLNLAEFKKVTFEIKDNLLK